MVRDRMSNGVGKPPRRYFWAGFLVLLLLSGVSSGADIYVDDDAPGDPCAGDPTISDPLEDGTPTHPFDAIEEGIQKAYSTPATGDTVIVRDGTYMGVGNRGLELDGSEVITVRSEYGPANCIIDCQGADRGFYIHSNDSSTVEGFTITNGSATFGGGIEVDGAMPTISDCVIQGNSANYYGGGVDLYLSAAVLTDCRILGNAAKYGGGINCDFDASDVNSCEISDNSASDVGGGLSCYDSNTLLTNCFVATNGATDVGGAVYIFNSDCLIGNFTIVNNTNPSGFGGVFFCDYRVQREPAIINSILWNNGDDLYNCQGLVSSSCIEDGDVGPGNTAADPLFVDPNFNPNWPTSWDPNGFYLSSVDANQLNDSACIDAGTGDVDDPAIGLGMGLFTTRTDHVADTGIVDMGYHRKSTLPVPLYELTTDFSGPGGAGTIDPFLPSGGQFHTQYSVIALTATVSDANLYRIAAWSGTDDDTSTDANNTVTMTEANTVTVTFADRPVQTLKIVVNGSGGDVTYIGVPNVPERQYPNPRSGVPYDFRYGDVVTIETLPSPGYVPVWPDGTTPPGSDPVDFPSSASSSNTITMDGDKEVHVSFRVVRTLLVPSEYSTIDGAIHDVHSGDAIVVAPGTYTPQNSAGFDFGDKNFTLRSEDPNDPAVVASTIIDCQGDRYFPRRAFHFDGSKYDTSAVVAGFTIINGYQRGDPPGADGQFGLLQPSPYESIDPNADDPNEEPPRAQRGSDSPDDDGYGGAILCEKGQRTIGPTISRCVFMNCTVTGGQGGDGARGQNASWFYWPNVLDPQLQEVDEGQWGGHGGTGRGDGRGGAIACKGLSNPIIEYCVFKDNTARGGRGGDGGNGGNGTWDPATLEWDSAGGGAGDGGDGIGDGFGGAIYCEGGSDPCIVGCTFSGNIAYQGVGGVAGALGEGTLLEDPPQSRVGENGLGDTSVAAMSGGALYCNSSAPSVSGCEFDDNKSGYVYETWWYTGGVYFQGGGIGAFSSNPLTISDSNFIENLGGAIYCGNLCVVALERCRVEDNYTDLSGGGVHMGERFGGVSSIDANECAFLGNQAAGDGGGLATASDTVLNDCSFSGNKAGGTGGGLYVLSPSSSLNRTTWLQLDCNSCSFTGNQSSSGGGVYGKYLVAEFTDTLVFRNGARTGGGLMLVRADIVFTGGLIYDNLAVGGEGAQSGGGAVCNMTGAVFDNVVFRDNEAQGGCSGGGLAFYGGEGETTAHEVKNCLFVDNSAAVDGGGLWCGVSVLPRLVNCTFSGNDAGGFGGAVACDWSSSVVLKDSIFADSNGVAISEDDNQGAVIEYCLFHENPQGDYGLHDSATGEVTTFPVSGIGMGNLQADPVFAEGPFGAFYLDQALSPAVDSGSVTASERGLQALTTDPDPNGITDAGQLDRGYHYRPLAGLDLFELTLGVVADEGGTLTVSSPESVIPDPNGQVYTYYGWTIVELEARPNGGYRVHRWYETLDDSSTLNTNIVVMRSDKLVQVEFGQPRTIVVSSDANHTDLQWAVDDAQDGDVIMLPTGTYTMQWSGWDADWPRQVSVYVVDKGITITGTNPTDANIVSSTVLEDLRILVYGSLGLPEELLGATPTIIDGITFTCDHDNWHDDPGCIGVSWRPAIIRNCRFVDCIYDGWNPPERDEPHDDGRNAGSVFGGGIGLWGSNAEIRNCYFRNCVIQGGEGEDGHAGESGHEDGYDGGWAGKAYGGGVYIDHDSTVSLFDCTFIDCVAKGGRGGDGGDAEDTDAEEGQHGGRGGNWEWADNSLVTWWLLYRWDGWDWGPYEDYWKYSGYGGAVYTESNNLTKFVRCKFVGNISEGGACGRGGMPWRLPYEYENIENLGGGVYVANGSAEFVGCTFSDNLANTAFDSETIMIIPDTPPFVPDDVYISHGGAVAIEDAGTVKFIDCDVNKCSATMGGGIYWTNSTVELADCNVGNNSAYYGAGLYSIDSASTLTGCTLVQNEASKNAYIPPLDANLPPYAPKIKGDGGGYYCFSTLADIIDCEVLDNRATGSGGGIYFGGSDQTLGAVPLVHNCLVTGNRASSDGGGISSNFYAAPVISSTTIAENTLDGIRSYGGGLACSYDSTVDVIDSIIWANRATDGAQVAVRTGFEHEPRTSTVWINFSDVGPSDGILTPPDFDGGAGSGDSQGASGGDDGGGAMALSTAESSVEETEEGQAAISSEPAVLVGAKHIKEKFQAGKDKVKVIVTLKEPSARRKVNWRSPKAVKKLQDKIAKQQAKVMSRLQPAEFKKRRLYKNHAGFSCELTQAALAKLLADPNVASVEPVRYAQVATAQSIPLINATGARQIYDSSGIAIAIVDTGVDYTHPKLGGGGFPNSKVIGGYDTADDDPDPMPEGTNPIVAHGTLVAGVAAGDLGLEADYIGGVAHDAKIYALKLTEADAGTFPNDNALAAWDWCLTHQNDDPLHPIMIINNSWVDIALIPFDDPNDADAYQPAFTSLADRLTQAGVTILASSGNTGFAGDGISWPAAMSKVISVGAVYDDEFETDDCAGGTQYVYADKVTCWSNSADNLDLLAPGEWLSTTDIVGYLGSNPGDYEPNFAGTSASCPMAAGAAAVLQSAFYEKVGHYMTPDEVRALLVANGDPITDTKVNVTKPRINLGAAISTLEITAPVLVDVNCALNGREPNSPEESLILDITEWDPEADDIAADPCFVPDSDYFLSHVAAGQDFDSPCIDAGSGDVNDPNIGLGMGLFTTRTDRKPDSGDVDLGYHHDANPPRYQLCVWVVDSNDIVVGSVDGHGYVDPNWGEFFEDDVVTLQAYPDPNFRVAQWKGTDNDDSRDQTNTVTMTGDTELIEVTIRFEQIPLPSKIFVSGDPNALQDAIEAAADWDMLVVMPGTYNGNINTRGKKITITGTNPLDANVVARTIIDANGQGRGFIFDSGEDSNTVVMGLTIINGDVNDGGGGILIESGCDPCIVSVVVRDCNALGGPGATRPSGGGIFVSSYSSPNFVDVTVTGCAAVDGGGVFCEFGSSTRFWGCKFISNFAVNTGGGVLFDQDSVYEVNDCNFLENDALVGGGLYGGIDSKGTIIDTIFRGNEAAEEGGGICLEEANDVLIWDSNMFENSALRGAGMCSVQSSTLTLLGCQVKFNYAPVAALDVNDPNDPNSYLVGQGGGVFCFDTPAHIKDCVISNNFANTSGGGVYLLAGPDPAVENCLIVNNQAGRDGGGVSANWFCDALISNCTFSGNNATGLFGDNDGNGLGGGLYCAYESDCNVRDCIFWEDSAVLGQEIAVGVGFEFDPRPSQLTVRYSDVDGGRSSMNVEPDCNVFGYDPISDPGHYPSNINTDPLFATGPLGFYYLNQPPEQASLSPCVDAGSAPASAFGLNAYTTRTDELFDRGDVDMGYHYPLEIMVPCRLADLWRDGFIAFEDYARFALRWWVGDCWDGNGWCQGADFTFDSDVDYDDVGFLADCWLEIDMDAPFPDPAQWYIEPCSPQGAHYITMGAVESIDAWGWPVDYHFVCISDSNFTSSWQEDPNYTISGLALGTELCFKVHTRDQAPSFGDPNDPNHYNTERAKKDPNRPHETEFSQVLCARAGGDAVADTTAPTPAPHIVTIEPNYLSTPWTEVVMTAKQAFDNSGVEYYFQSVGANGLPADANGHDSEWQDELVYVDVNLVPQEQVCYRVQARDKSANQNTTEWSEIRCVTLPPPPDENPPTPDPMQWDPTADSNGFDGTPREVQVGPDPVWDWGATMRADPATADDSGPFEFYFECVTRSDFSSGWISFAGPPYVYTVEVGMPNQGHIFRVRARDQFLNMTAWSAPDVAN